MLPKFSSASKGEINNTQGNSAGKISNVVKYCIWYTMNVKLVAFGAVTLNAFGVNVLNVK